MSSKGGAKWIRECMEHYGLSATDLAARTGLSFKTVQRVVKGRTYATTDAHRARIAEVFRQEYEKRYGRRGAGVG